MKHKKKKIKYHVNRRKYDCAIVAIINSFKWAGQEISYTKHKKELDYIFEYIPEHGVEIDRFDKFIRRDKHFPYHVTKIKEGITIEDYKQTLSDDTICIMLAQMNPETIHAFLVTKLTKNFLTLINWSRDKAIKRMSVDRFKKILKDSNIGYFITKRTVI